MYRVYIEGYRDVFRVYRVCKGRNDSCMVAAILCVYYLEELMCLVVWYVYCEGDVCNIVIVHLLILLYVVCGEIPKVCYYSKVYNPLYQPTMLLVGNLFLYYESTTIGYIDSLFVCLFVCCSISVPIFCLRLMTDSDILDLISLT